MLSFFDDVALMVGVLLAAADYFDRSERIEKKLDQFRAVAKSIAFSAFSFLAKVIKQLVGLVVVSMVVALLYSLPASVFALDPIFQVASLPMKVCMALIATVAFTGTLALWTANLVVILYIVGSALLGLLAFLSGILAALFSALDYPPKGTVASIGIALMAYDLLRRFEFI